MAPEDRRTVPFVLLVSATSVTWGLWEGRAYWTALSFLAMAWAVWALWHRVEAVDLSWQVMSASLAVIPAMGLLAGPEAWAFLEALLAPVLLYCLSVSTIAPTLGASGECGTRVLALVTFLATISAGCLALLSLYYLDSLLSTALLDDNTELMWPLSFLLLGALSISTTVHLLGLEERMWRTEEVSG